MFVKAAIGEVTLQSVYPIAPKHPRRDAIVDQVAVDVRMKRQCRVAAERRDLVVDVLAQQTLQGENAVVILLELCLPELDRRGRAHHRQRKPGGLTRIAGDLKVGQVESTEQTQPRRGAQEVRKIAEVVPDGGEVVLGLRARRGRLQAAAILKIITGRVIA